MILMMFLLFGFIQHVSSIKCFTCNGEGSFCPVPFNIEDGEEQNENNIEAPLYDSSHVCQSDNYIDPNTGQEKLVLRGVKYCEELDIPNHRTHCCNQDNCNKVRPPMTREPFIPSNNQQYLSSMILIIFSIIFQYIYQQL